MARQGHRVWLARLTLGFVILVLVVGFGLRTIWNRWASDSPSTASNRTPLPTVANETSDSPPHALDPILTVARRALENHMLEHNDYTATLIKRERINGKLLPETKMEMKLLYRPATPTADTPTQERKVSVYLKTIEPSSQAGREVIWVQGHNKNQITAHEAGLLGLISVQISPNSSLAMMGNRYPITQIGIENLLRKLIEKGERDRLLGPAIVRRTEKVLLGKVECTLLEIIHEEPSIQIGAERIEFEYFLAQIYIDEERLVPLKYASYTWPNVDGGKPELEEEYAYEGLSINVGLTDSDFDSTNPNYHF